MNKKIPQFGGFFYSGNLFPLVIVFEPHDVVFFEVVADLALDEVCGYAARVFQSVHGAGRNERTFALIEDAFFGTDGHLRGTGYHYPMFATVVVHLGGEAFAGENGEALRLEADAFVDNRIAAPRTVDRKMGFGNGREAFLQDFYGFLNLLGRTFLRDEKGVFGVYGDKVFAIDEDYRLFGNVGIRVVVLRRNLDHVGRRDFAGVFFERVEASEVGPTDIG